MTHGRMTRIRPTPCPYCGQTNNSVTDPGGTATPAPGDVSLCLGCGEFLVLDGRLRTCIPSPDELIEIGLDSEARRLRRGWLAWKQRLQS